MKTIHRKYNHEKDFIKIRDLLVSAYSHFDQPINWTLERWNYARHFVVPMIGAYGKDPVTLEDSLEAIRYWVDNTHVWETSGGDIAAVLTIEHPFPGTVFFLRDIGFDGVLKEMLSIAEETLINPEKCTLNVYICDHDPALKSVASEIGYHRLNDRSEEISEFIIQEVIPEPVLPQGFRIQSMADENDIEKRRKAFGRGFNHEDHLEWPSTFSYQELQKAPDYNPELDLYIVAPDDEYVAFCIVWWDQVNRIATLEPVGTVPNYRRMGLARAVVLEGIIRASALGAQKVIVGSGVEFYLAIGFKISSSAHFWQKEFRKD